MKRLIGLVAVAALGAIGFATSAASPPAPESPTQLTPIEQLGKFLFFDEDLSTPPGQSCAACHGPDVGFTGPNAEINMFLGGIYPGAVHVRFGNRKPPSAAYGGDSPVLHLDPDESIFIGGMFWDGRATGWTLGDPLAEQAQGPFLNPLEQNNPNPRTVLLKVARSDYADLYEEVFGAPVDFRRGVREAYENLAFAIAAYERSSEVSAFSSKYDAYLAGLTDLTDQEAWGLELFNAEDKGNCAACHPSSLGPYGELPLFTDFTYDNLGLPANPDNPFYGMPPNWNPDGADWTDPGLGGFLAAAGYPDLVESNLGKHKVPTLRNVDKRPYPEFVKTYGHNGAFASLEAIVHFYNARDVEPWPPAEVPMNVNDDELGDLGLTPEEEAAIVAFLRTLSDGWMP